MEYQTILIDNSASVTKNYVLVDPELETEYLNQENFPGGESQSPEFDIPI